MKKRTVFTFMSVIGLRMLLMAASCQENPYPGIPTGSLFQDRSYDYSVFLHYDDADCYPEKVSIWSYNHKTGKAKRIVTTTGEHVAIWVKSDTVKSYEPKDSIAAIFSADIISLPNEPLRIVVNGCPDQRNVWTYIVSEDSDSALLLPTNAGFLGEAIEEDLLIGQSYEYYGQGCRYNVLKVFDREGNLLQQIPINQQENIPFEVFMTQMFGDWEDSEE